MMLTKWTLTYIKNRDVMLKKISKVEDKKEYILVTNKDETHIVYIVKEKLTSLAPIMRRFKELEEEHKANKFTLVLYNQRQNLDQVISAWDNLLDLEKLTIVFANPETNEKWVVAPYVHDKIADPQNLKNGLVSLFEGVEEYQE